MLGRFNCVEQRVYAGMSGILGLLKIWSSVFVFELESLKKLKEYICAISLMKQKMNENCPIF